MSSCASFASSIELHTSCDANSMVAYIQGLTFGLKNDGTFHRDMNGIEQIDVVLFFVFVLLRPPSASKPRLCQLNVLVVVIYHCLS